MRYLTALVLTAALAGVASADIAGEVQSYITPDASTDALSPIVGGDYVTNDIVVTTDTDWLSAVVEIVLTQGSIYQHAAGGDTAPNPLFFPVYPALEYDTYVQNGAGESVGILPAVDYGYAAVENGTTTYALSWNTVDTDDIGVLPLLRATLSSDAQGTWKTRITALSDDIENPYEYVMEDGSVVDGYMIPEPATMALLGIGGLAALIRRKK